MTRGRKPTPTKIKILRGNPGKRKLTVDEPAPPEGLPKAPAYLSDSARAEYLRLGRELLAAGVMTVLDENALASYCVMRTRWLEAEAHLAKDGQVYEDKFGQQHKSPWVAIAMNCNTQMNRIGSEFGLLPSSRSRLHVPPKAAEDPLEKLRQANKRGSA